MASVCSLGALLPSQSLQGILQEAVSRREYWRLIDSQASCVDLQALPGCRMGGTPPAPVDCTLLMQHHPECSLACVAVHTLAQFREPQRCAAGSCSRPLPISRAAVSLGCLRCRGGRRACWGCGPPGRSPSWRTTTQVGRDVFFVRVGCCCRCLFWCVLRKR